MILICSVIAGFLIGIIVGFLISESKVNSYRNPNYTPLADAEIRRMHERMQDYYNNPVVEYMKRNNKR